MNIIRMTAFIAVTMTAFACDSRKTSKDMEGLKKMPFSHYLMPGNDYETEDKNKKEIMKGSMLILQVNQMFQAMHNTLRINKNNYNNLQLSNPTGIKR